MLLIDVVVTSMEVAAEPGRKAKPIDVRETL